MWLSKKLVMNVYTMNVTCSYFGSQLKNVCNKCMCVVPIIYIYIYMCTHTCIISFLHGLLKLFRDWQRVFNFWSCHNKYLTLLHYFYSVHVIEYTHVDTVEIFIFVKPCIYIYLYIHFVCISKYLCSFVYIHLFF